MKTKTLTKIIQFTCVAAAMLTGATVHAASITYTYTGNSFTDVTGPYSTSDMVTGFVTFSSPLAANLPLTAETPTAFSFSDGVQTITSANATSTDFIFATGKHGEIVEWLIEVETSGGVDLIESGDEGPGTSEDIGLMDVGRGFNSGNPGVWTGGGASVPDSGATSLLLLASVTTLVVARQRFARSAI
jgi:hypothetical protein